MTRVRPRQVEPLPSAQAVRSYNQPLARARREACPRRRSAISLEAGLSRRTIGARRARPLAKPPVAEAESLVVDGRSAEAALLHVAARREATVENGRISPSHRSASRRNLLRSCAVSCAPVGGWRDALGGVPRRRGLAGRGATPCSPVSPASAVPVSRLADRRDDGPRVRGGVPRPAGGQRPLLPVGQPCENTWRCRGDMGPPWSDRPAPLPRGRVGGRSGAPGRRVISAAVD